MESSPESVRHYHDLLQEKYLDSTREALEAAIGPRKLSFGNRPACNVLRPFFLERSTYESIHRATEHVVRGISKLTAELLRDPALRREMDLTPEEDEIIQIPTGYGAPDLSSRLDGFLTAAGDFRFVEYNADSPGGIAYGDELADLFLEMPVLKEFSRRYPVSKIPVRSLVLENLAAAYRRWGGIRKPNIGIVDWKTGPTFNEFLLMQEFFQQNGYNAKVVDPSELEYRHGALVAGDFSIDLIYKRLLVGDILKSSGLSHPIVQAARERNVCVANGFAVQMLFKKTLFVLLSDPAYAHYFDEPTTRALQKHIPWTRKLRDSKTIYEGKKIDLVEFAAENRDRLVIKPSSEYGGKGVLLGWETSAEDWKAAISRSLQESCILQERVEIGEQIFPSIANGRVEFASRYFDLDPYIWNGEDAQGCGVRLSSFALLNVSAGGGSATPMLLLD